MKRFGLWLMAIALLICSAFAAVACDKPKGEDSSNAYTFVELSETAISIEKYSQYTLKAVTNVEEEIVWTTADEKVATVEGGVVSALSIGSTVITASVSGAEASCEVTVVELSSFPSLELEKTNVELVVGGDSILVQAAASYKGVALNCEWTWTSENPSIATVEGGRITPVAIGSTVVTVKTECMGEILVGEINVQVKPDEHIVLSKGGILLALAEVNANDTTSSTFTAQAFKDGAINEGATLTFLSSNEEVATVVANGNEATVTAVGVGECIVSVSYESEVGKIESSLTVNVERSKVTLENLIDLSYEGAETALNLTSLGLMGEFEGVYFNEELVSAADGKLDSAFVETNTSIGAFPVELRTNVAVYFAQMAITVRYMDTAIVTGETSSALPAYEGDVTAAGFEEGAALQNYTVTGSDAAYSNRLTAKDSGSFRGFDHWIVEFSLDQAPTGSANHGYFLTVWVGTTHLVLVKTEGMYAYAFQPGEYAEDNEEHGKNPCVSIYNAEGKIPYKLKANEKYYFEMHLEHADPGDIFAFAFNDALNVRIGQTFMCTDAYYQEFIAPNRDNTPAQPEMSNVVYDCNSQELPRYEGDVTEVGFAEGAPVYKHEQDNRSSMWNPGTNLQLTMEDQTILLAKEADEDYASILFSLSRELTSTFAFTAWWIDALGVNQGLVGYLTREGGMLHVIDDFGIVALDASGKVATSFAPNTVYELRFYGIGATTFKVGCCEENGESITLYFANPSHGNGDIPSADPDTPIQPDTPTKPSVTQGDNRSDMPTYDGDVTAIGFPAETEPVYVVVGGSAAWENRIVMGVVSGKDCLKFDFTVSKEVSNVTMWPGTANGTNGSYSVTGQGYTPASGANSARVITVLDEKGNKPTKFEAGKVYTVYFYLIDETDVQCSVFVDATLYIANVESIDVEDEPTVDANEIYDCNNKLLDLYEGDVTALGFERGTTVYEQAQDIRMNGMWSPGTQLELTMEQQTILLHKEADEDYASILFSLSRELTSTFAFTAWWINAEGANQGLVGYLTVTGGWQGVTTGFKTVAYDMDGNKVSSFAANTAYELRFYGKGATIFKVGCCEEKNSAALTVYYANPSHGNEEVFDQSVTQGEQRKPMPTYSGDVTALGFETGTVVYQIVGPQSNASDVKLVAQVDSTGDNAYAKLDFVLSASTASLGLWITAANSHLGYYTVTPTGFTADSIGDPSRTIFVTDANGEKLTSTSFAANKVYTLYIRLDGREVTVQLSTWASLTIYVANVDCITEAEAPVAPLPPVQGKEISVLFIGNSFSDDTEAYMVDILLNLGYTNINVGNLYIGGCSIDTHYDNIMHNRSAYDFRMRSHNGSKYTEYETVSVGGEKKSIAFAIAYKDWDVISVQQASGDSGKASTYSNLDALVSEVKKQATNADVEIVFNMTWAYQGDSTHAQFPDYNSDQTTMYNAIVSAVQAKVSYTVVPNGTAIQNARTSLLGDTLTRDGYHLDLKIGRFIAGLTFVAKVTGADLDDLTYAPNGINEVQLAVALESVQNALTTPFAVTESEIQEETIEDPDVTTGGSNATAVTVYKGDETALGFAEGSTVYEYVGVDSSSDKAAIKVDSSKYDYVEVQFVIAKGNGYFFLHGRKDGNWYNKGISYIIDPSWLRLGDGNNTPSDRVIEVYDADGNKVTTLMKNNVLYTLRVYVKVGELDEITIGMSGSTIYFANVSYGCDSDAN